MRRFVDAWEAVDIDGMTALLAGDALITMPPEPMRVVGPAAIGRFFATVPLDGRLDLIRLVPTGANGQPTLAAYVQENHGIRRLPRVVSRLLPPHRARLKRRPIEFRANG